MAKLVLTIFTLLCFSTLITNSQSLFEETKTINPKPIRVYLIVVGEDGPNPTLYEVARSKISTTPTSFGIVYVGDFSISAGPDLNSQQLGRVQGTVTTTSLNASEPGEVVNFNLIFTDGKYRGSSLIIAGQRLVFGRDQEVPIAGGTGFFRGARGYALTSFVSYTPNTDTYTFAYDIVLGGGIFG